MKHIVYIIPYLVNCGPVNVLYGIVRHLDKTRFKATVVTLKPMSVVNERKKFEEAGTRILGLNYTNMQLQLNTAMIAKELSQRFGRDGNTIFHANGYYPTLILSKMKRAKTMNTIHNICDEEFKINRGRVFGGYMAWRYKKALRRLSLCVTISDAMKLHYVKDRRVRLSVVYNGTEMPTVVTKDEKEKARRELGVQPETRVLLYPAGFSPRKNQRFLIEAIRRSCIKDVVVLFAGSGDSEESCRTIAGEDKRFRFLGFRADMERLWRAADFMVSSSLSEGLPMAVLEALMCGLPCILSDIPPHREIMQRVFGNDSLLFSLQEANSFTRLLQAVLREEFNHKEIAARAAMYYSSETMANGYMRLYELM